MFDKVITLWKSEDLLSQAWEESFKMMVLSNEMFNAAIKYLRRGEKIKTLKNLKKRDREINEFQKSVRKKVVTHFSISQKVEDFPSGLVLLNIVVDVERLGDYTKNILDLACKKNATVLVASTSEVYGDPLEHPQSESYFGNVNPIGPRAVYDEAKRFLEALSIAYKTNKKLNVRIVRIFNT